MGPVAEGQPSGAGRVARVLRWQSIDLLAQTVPCALVAEEAQGQRFPRLRQLGQPMGPAVRGMLKTWTLWLRGQPQDEATRRWLMDFNQVVQAEIRKIQDSGKQEGLRTAVRDLCEVLGIVLTAAQQAHLDSLDLDGLGALRAHLKSARSWPLGS